MARGSIVKTVKQDPSSLLVRSALLNWTNNARSKVYTPSTTSNKNAPHEAGHYLSLVARGGIEPPTQGFSKILR